MTTFNGPIEANVPTGELAHRTAVLDARFPRRTVLTTRFRRQIERSCSPDVMNWMISLRTLSGWRDSDRVRILKTIWSAQSPVSDSRKSPSCLHFLPPTQRYPSYSPE